MKTVQYLTKSVLLFVTLFSFFAFANGAWATDTAVNASNVMGTGTVSTSGLNIEEDDTAAGASVLKQVYNLIRFAYVFFYAIAVLLVAQSWLQFKQQKYEVMFASLGAALGLFLTPAIIDFLHGLGTATAS